MGSIGPIMGLGLGLNGRINTLVEASVSIAHGSPESTGGQSGAGVIAHFGIGVTLSTWGTSTGKAPNLSG
jgi:hypothetical protein